MSEELAWAAGLFEGEGHIGIKGQGRCFSLRCAVAMTDREVVLWFHERWDGHLDERHYMARLAGKPKPQLKWTVASRKAARFLVDIQPYLRSSRVQEKARIALEFQAQKLNTAAGRWAPPEYHDLQRSYFDRFHVLNARGLQ